MVGEEAREGGGGVVRGVERQRLLQEDASLLVMTTLARRDEVVVDGEGLHGRRGLEEVLVAWLVERLVGG